MKFINYLKESYIELKEHVTWISWEEAQKSTTVVAIFTVVFALLVLAADRTFQAVLKGLFNIF